MGTVTAGAILMALLWGFVCALCAVVFSVVLAGEDTPLNFWFRLIHPIYEDRRGWPRWFSAVAGACEKCLAGELAMFSSSVLCPWSWSAVSITTHMAASAAAVICALVIGKYLRWLKNRM